METWSLCTHRLQLIKERRVGIEEEGYLQNREQKNADEMEVVG
jgi:hypothetical protein